ncbi:hypothetical protein CDAR_57781 [Caerostris darwini]|uniref:Uncharacterized protein n=1 Tax=Caerostris darwini TaxID=1538125 RepID=A0AAV4PAV5_9ARAC|nr:hypothetical protein CDAR_57701 [Caerostris darwini]GIX93108.1 hypothetical protein CDAR_57781 [Caerostris darwini]
MIRIYRYSSAGSECIAVPQHYQKLSLLIGMTESNTVPRHDKNLSLFSPFRISLGLGMIRIYRCSRHDQNLSLGLGMIRIYRYSSAGSECIAVPQHYQKLSLLIGMTESNTVPRHDKNLSLFSP